MTVPEGSELPVCLCDVRSESSVGVRCAAGTSDWAGPELQQALCQTPLEANAGALRGWQGTLAHCRGSALESAAQDTQLLAAETSAVGQQPPAAGP